MSDKKLSRREALLLAAATSGAAYYSTSFQFFLNTVADALVSKAHAQDAVTLARNYVFIQLSGAPPRWTWDPLTPFESEGNINLNGQVGTRFRATGAAAYTDVEYKTTPIKGINMPWMWRYNVPSPGGGSRPMGDLIDDMMIIRGVNCGNPAHTGARPLQFVPSGIPYSLTALSSDINPNPLPHINMSTSDTVYASKLGKAKIDISNGGNMLDKLLQPFDESVNQTFLNNKAKVDSAIANSIDKMNNQATADHPGADSVAATQRNVDQLFGTDFSQLSSIWTSTRNKYLDLINRANNQNSNLNLLTDAKADTIKQSIAFSNLADYFAVTEYCLLNELSSSIAFRVRRSAVSMDEHQVDKLDSLYANTQMNRVLASCVLALKDALMNSPKGNLFDETLIHIQGEFGRNPRHDGTGSDHDPKAGSSTLISGCLKGREVVGNITKGTTTGNRRGTWGVQANNPGFGLLSSGHLANTIADILRAPKPITAVPTLVEEVGGKWQSRLPNGRIV